VAKCALLFPSVGLDLAAKLAGAEIAWALDMSGGLIERMLRSNHKDLPFYGDPSAFPFKLDDAELKCDLWITANALGAIFALKKVAHRDALPSRVVAQVSSLIELPAFVRAWFESGLFPRIEWWSEDVREHGTPVKEKQIYMVGFVKGCSPVEFGAPTETLRPRLCKEYWDGKAWSGPAFLDPRAETSEGMGYIQALRHGAVVSAAKSILVRPCDPPKTTQGEPFAKFRIDVGRMIVAKITDGGIQMLLDDSPEQFFEVWPVNGVCDEKGTMYPVMRGFNAQVKNDEFGLPAFSSGTRNSKYIMAALGVPYTYVPA